MKLGDFIINDAIIPELQSSDRDGVIRELVQALADQGAISADEVDAVTEIAVKRENEGSTGFGKGVAVPHVKHETIGKLMASIGRSSTGIDFASLDRAPVYTVVLLISSKEDPDAHLAAMEQIFRHLQRDNFRRFLRQADTREAIVDLINEADEMSAA